MRVRGLDSDGDWTFGKGVQDYKQNGDALEQNLVTRLKSWRGDCFFAPQEGVDWNNFLDRGTKDFLDRDIKRVIIQTEGVLRIDSYTSDLPVDRDLNVEAKLSTIYGSLDINNVFEVTV